MRSSLPICRHSDESFTDEGVTVHPSFAKKSDFKRKMRSGLESHDVLRSQAIDRLNKHIAELRFGLHRCVPCERAMVKKLDVETLMKKGPWKGSKLGVDGDGNTTLTHPGGGVLTLYKR